MRAKITWPLVALVSTLGLTTFAYSADYGSSTGNSSNNSAGVAPAASPIISGTVQSVDSTNKLVQLKDATGNVQTVKVENGTQISRDGAIIQLAQLNKGDSVTVTNPSAAM